LAKLDKTQAEVDSKKGVTGTNVAAALLWVQGLAYTYHDAGEATRLVSDRRSAPTACITIRIAHPENFLASPAPFVEQAAPLLNP
jgi:hypothetical protein